MHICRPTFARGLQRLRIGDKSTPDLATDFGKLIPLQASTSMNGSADVSPASDPVAGLTAAKPKDFQILINLVDFCR
jgi:hypothetical protein